MDTAYLPVQGKTMDDRVKSATELTLACEAAQCKEALAAFSRYLPGTTFHYTRCDDDARLSWRELMGGLI